MLSLIRLLNVLNIGYSSIFFAVFLDPFCFVLMLSHLKVKKREVESANASPFIDRRRALKKR